MTYEAQPLYKAVFTVHNLVFVLFGSLLALNVIVALHHNEQVNTSKALVYAICQEARQEDNGASEQACGDVQDQTGTEYLCQHRNALASNNCWVEVK